MENTAETKSKKNRWHLRILDKYIFREVCLTFLFGICAFTTVFVGSGTLFRIARLITVYGASIPAVIKVFIFSLPGIVVWTFPMSMLLGTLLAFGRLSGGSEITAMKSCGVSFWRIATPALLLGFCMSLFSVWFNENVVPWANTAYAHVINYEIKGNTKPMSQDHIIIKEFKNNEIERLIYARRYDADTETMKNLTMQVFENNRVTHVENAVYAKWQNNSWTMYNGTVYDIPKEETGKETSKHVMQFKSQALPINESPRSIINSQKKPDEMTIKELKQQIAIMNLQFLKTKELETELHQRFTIPFASFIFALIGVPLGLQPNRASSSRGFAISLVIIFIYYTLMTIGGAFAQSGMLPVMLGVWIPNIVGFIIGSRLMWKAAQ